MIRNLTARAEVLIIVLLAFIPLFIQLPYRVNIFLSWEGAYRMSQGQLPFRDFGIPLGGMYWVIPAIFFKLLGAKLITLIKAQVFINIIAGLSFRSILISLGVDKGIRLASVLLFCISYSFFNFWPWYNHSVIFYELAGLACLFRYIRGGLETRIGQGSGGVGKMDWKRLGWLLAAALFFCCSLLTKQDGGGLALLIAFALVGVHSVYQRDWKPMVFFGLGFVLLFLLIIAPFLHSGFGYWWNHGQAPHTARVSIADIAEEFFGSSQWIKFYLFITLALVVVRYRDLQSAREDQKGVLLVVLTWGILAEAAIFQVTSYTPPDNNIFFHAFAFACIFSLLSPLLRSIAAKPVFTGIMLAGIMLWWSGTWWKYTQRLTGGIFAHKEAPSTGENVVNRSTFMINLDTARDVPMDQWVECGLPSFKKIVMPAPTADGIHRLLEMDLIKSHRGQYGLKVLNMSELTPLAAEIPFELEKNGELPLWYHLGVGMFNRQAGIFEGRIKDHYYDLVLFEYIPTLNNFYPFRVRDSLRSHYKLVDSFLAPRRGLETKGQIEVYVRP